MSVKKLEVIRIQRVKAANCEVIKAELKHILLSILKLTLSHFDRAEINIVEGPQTTVFEVDVDRDDFGKLLGNKGKNIEALRTILATVGGAHGFRAVLQVRDEKKFF